jgi:hypothetical protein
MFNPKESTFQGITHIDFVTDAEKKGRATPHVLAQPTRALFRGHPRPVFFSKLNAKFDYSLRSFVSCIVLALVRLIREGKQDVQQELTAEQFELWQTSDPAKMANDEVEGVLFHVDRLDAVCCLQNLDHVLERHVHLQIVLAEGLKIPNKKKFKREMAVKSTPT